MLWPVCFVAVCAAIHLQDAFDEKAIVCVCAKANIRLICIYVKLVRSSARVGGGKMTYEPHENLQPDLPHLLQLAIFSGLYPRESSSRVLQVHYREPDYTCRQSNPLYLQRRRKQGTIKLMLVSLITSCDNPLQCDCSSALYSGSRRSELADRTRAKVRRCVSNISIPD